MNRKRGRPKKIIQQQSQPLTSNTRKFNMSPSDLPPNLEIEDWEQEISGTDN